MAYNFPPGLLNPWTVPPVAANWTRKGATASSLVDSTFRGAPCLLVTSSTAQDAFFYNTAIGPTFTVTAALLGAWLTSNGVTGIAISNSGGTPFIRFGCYASGSAWNLQVQRFANLATPGVVSYGPTDIGSMVDAASGIWLRVQQDATNLIFSFSPNGMDWFVVLSQAKAAFLVANQLYVMANDDPASANATRLVSLTVV